ERLMKRSLPREVIPGFEAGKPSTIEEDTPHRSTPRRTHQQARPAKSQKKPAPAKQQQQRRDGGHTRAVTKVAHPSKPAPAKQHAAHESAKPATGGANGNSAHAPRSMPGNSTTAHAPRRDKRPGNRSSGGRNAPTEVVRSNLPPGWPGSSRGR